MTLLGIFRNTWFQLVFAVGFAVVLCTDWASNDWTLRETPFSDVASFLVFSFGVATIFAIIGPLYFGFLTQQIQSCREERMEAYWRLEDSVTELGRIMRDANGGRGPHYKIAERLRDLEGLRLEHLDQVETLQHHFRHVHRIARWVLKKSRENGRKTFAEFDADLFRVLMDIEERLGVLGINLIRRVCLDPIRRNVNKCLYCVGLLLFLSLLSLSFYSKSTGGLFWVAVTAIATFAVVTTIELATWASQETRDMAPLTDDDTDLDGDLA